MRCTGCGTALAGTDAFCGKCGAPVTGGRTQTTPVVRSQALPNVVVRDVVGSLVAIGDGNVQVQVRVDGTSQVSQRDGGLELRPRELPVAATTSWTTLIGRSPLVEEAYQALSAGTSVQLFGAPGVGRSAVAEAVLRRMAADGAPCVDVRPDNEPYSLESLYRRLMNVFFGVAWYQPDEAVLRLEVARFGLRALIMIIDCDLGADDLGRLLGTFPNCRFLLTSHRRTLPDDSATALEVDPLSPAEARELITRALGGAPVGLQNLQWEQAYRLAGGQIQRLMEHIAFIKRSVSRPGQTDLLNVPISEQLAILVAGLTEAARRVIVALATYQLALAPSAFAAVTGLPEAANAADELKTAGVVSDDGRALRIAPDAVAVLAATGQRSDPAIAADGLLLMLSRPDPPDPHLVLAVARALRQSGDDVGTVKLTRAGAPAAIAAGAIGVWISLVALGVQSATSSRRTQDLEFFLNEEHTSAMLRGDMVAAAAALATLGALLAEQQGTPTPRTHQPSPAAHQGTPLRAVPQGQRAVRSGRHGWFASHPAVVIAGVATAVAVAAAVIATALSSTGPNSSIVGAWQDGSDATFTFSSAGSGTYQVSLAFLEGTTHCSIADDGKVTGGDGHFQGTLDLHSAAALPAGQCPAQDGTAQMTFTIAANGTSAAVGLVANSEEDCGSCKPQTWTRRS
jgi:hypothetical protein